MAETKRVSMPRGKKRIAGDFMVLTSGMMGLFVRR